MKLIKLISNLTSVFQKNELRTDDWSLLKDKLRKQNLNNEEPCFDASPEHAADNVVIADQNKAATFVQILQQLAEHPDAYQPIRRPSVVSAVESRQLQYLTARTMERKVVGSLQAATQRVMI